jgi:hypothetical protein
MARMIHLYIVVNDETAQNIVESVLETALSDYHWDITDVEEGMADDEDDDELL